MKNKTNWPKRICSWSVCGTIYLSIPFTWLLKEAKKYLELIPNTPAVVGGPAVLLMPGYFKGLSNVEERKSMPGVLSLINNQATRTTVGCIRKCEFCGVSKIEPEFKELSNWPDLPIICDNNILAASQKHFDKVCDRLEKWGWCDFNQGIDARLLTEYHAKRFKRIGRPIIRLALDSASLCDIWENAFSILLKVGCKKSWIKTYCLVGFKDNPETAWKNCSFIQTHGIKAFPMWYHSLTEEIYNNVSDEQTRNGWSQFERKRIMGWFYKHKEVKQ